MDQVVCIDDSPGPNGEIAVGLHKGSIYTIISECRYGRHWKVNKKYGIILAEIPTPPAPKGAGYTYCCWNPVRFRAVRRTDIGAITALLHSAPITCEPIEA